MRQSDSPVDPAQIRGWIAAGRLETCKPGRRRLVDRAQHDRLCIEHDRSRQALPKNAPNAPANGDVLELDERILRVAGGK